jgi:hypothetical protein
LLFGGLGGGYYAAYQLWRAGPRRAVLSLVIVVVLIFWLLGGGPF